MKSIFFLILFCSLLTLAQNENIEDDLDGDGLTGNEDKFPFLADSPNFFWEVNELIFTWDIDLEVLKQNVKGDIQSELTQSNFSFGATRKKYTEIETGFSLTLNPFKLFADTGIKFKAGIHNSEYSKWENSEEKRFETCIKAFEFQKIAIKNPHWEITVWFTNNTKNNIIAEDLEVPLLDINSNVITYAVPYSNERKSNFRIPAMRKVAIKFRAETNTQKALLELNNIKNFVPIFAIQNSQGILKFQEDTNQKLDLISMISFMKQKTISLTFECNDFQISWRISKLDENNKTITLEKALLEIDRRLKNIDTYIPH